MSGWLDLEDDAGESRKDIELDEDDEGAELEPGPGLLAGMRGARTLAMVVKSEVPAAPCPAEAR